MLLTDSSNVTVTAPDDGWIYVTGYTSLGNIEGELHLYINGVTYLIGKSKNQFDNASSFLPVHKGDEIKTLSKWGGSIQFIPYK